MGHEPDWSKIILGRSEQPIRRKMNKRKVDVVSEVYPACCQS